MNNLSGNLQGNLTAGAAPAESEAVRLVARARVMMTISVLTTLLAIAAVVTVIGYRMYAAGSGPATEDTVVLPKGARVVTTSASAGRIALLLDIDGKSEILTFDIKTLKQTGRLRFSSEP